MIKVAAFLSYDHRDAVAAAHVHSEFLILSLSNYAAGILSFVNRRYSIDTWIDSASIPLGSDWREEILKGITACHVFVLIASTAHYSEHVAEEIGIANQLSKPVFPLYIDTPAALDQYQLGHLQGYRIPADSNDKAARAAFDEAITVGLDRLHLNDR
jgi:hypothetical protein